jgi:serine/threonine protein kinase
MDLYSVQDPQGEYFFDNTDMLRIIFIDGETTEDIIGSQLPIDVNFIIKVFLSPGAYAQELYTSTFLNNINVISDEECLHYQGTRILSIENMTRKTMGLPRKKCQRTLDSYQISDVGYGHEQDTSTSTSSYSLKTAVSQLLEQLMYLQSVDVCHCDIKADNIMKCGDRFQFIDWDLAVRTDQYTPEAFCSKRYTGSATHTSPLLVELIDIMCNKKLKVHLEKFKKSMSHFVKRRGITSDLCSINDETEEFLLQPENLRNALKFHTDLFSFSFTIYELTKMNARLKMSVNKFCDILQNTVNVEDNVFTYFNNGMKKISLSELIDLVPANYILVNKK